MVGGSPAGAPPRHNTYRIVRTTRVTSGSWTPSHDVAHQTPRQDTKSHIWEVRRPYRIRDARREPSLARPAGVRFRQSEAATKSLVPTYVGWNCRAQWRNRGIGPSPLTSRG